MWNSFTYILENDPEPLCLDFSVNKTVFDEASALCLEEVWHGSQNVESACMHIWLH